MPVIGPYTEGEIPPPLAVGFTESDGETVIDLDGWEAVFVIRLPGVADEVGEVEERTAVISQDRAIYVWVEADFAVRGPATGQIWVGNGTNRLASEIYEWDIEAGVGRTDVPDI